MQKLIEGPYLQIQQMVTALSEAGSTTEDADWIRVPGNAEDVAKYMRQKRVEQLSDLVIPSELDFEKLANEQKVFRYKYYSDESAKIVHQLLQKEFQLIRGKTCRVVVHNFGHSWDTPNAQELQRSGAYDANSAAFLLWTLKVKPHGVFASIPNVDDRAPFVYPTGGKQVLTYVRSDDCFEYNLADLRGGWSGTCSIVAFSVKEA